DMKSVQASFPGYEIRVWEAFG
ncbi:MAG: hypothetical protein JWQ02_1535, partial [Capsulimonas sp.]|nr:hypothetical protein [Capsulimonas sp.]